MCASGHKNLPPCRDEFVRTLQFMPQLGSDDSSHHGECDDVQGVRVDAIALEVMVQNDRGTDGCQPEQETEGSNVPGSKVDIRKHAALSIWCKSSRFAWRGEFAVVDLLFLIAAIRYSTHNHVFACLRPAPEDGSSFFARAACRTRACTRHSDLGRLRRPIHRADWRAEG